MFIWKMEELRLESGQDYFSFFLFVFKFLKGLGWSFLFFSFQLVYFVDGFRVGGVYLGLIVGFIFGVKNLVVEFWFNRGKREKGFGD